MASVLKHTGDCGGTQGRVSHAEVQGRCLSHPMRQTSVIICHRLGCQLDRIQSHQGDKLLSMPGKIS